jgi:hypothetical protein
MEIRAVTGLGDLQRELASDSVNIHAAGFLGIYH